jgi:hypothetical protein
LAPEIVCVVETGTPSEAAEGNVIAPSASAQKPPNDRGVRRVRRDAAVATTFRGTTAIASTLKNAANPIAC